jgi:isoleucyl-tRNA synthetase
VHSDLTYLKVRQGDEVFYVSKGAAATAIRGEHEVVAEVPGAGLVGLTYRGPFDELPAVRDAFAKVSDAPAPIVHRVIEWKDVSDAEGTGIVHIAPGCGKEDFHLGKDLGLAVIAPADDEGNYLDGFGFLDGRFVSADDTRDAIFESIRAKGQLYRTQKYAHRYPHCWRCGTELIFRLVDEWFISMDELRHEIAEVTRQIRWIPDFGLARELDWLKNMDDWMISKKRYYGLALPIYDCKECGMFEVIGSENELRQRAVEGWDEFHGHSPHKPHIDAVKVKCKGCDAVLSRIPDVGNPWLDAGIVPYSTLQYRHDRAYWERWFPAQFITEAFPGQFRNWFYSLLTMSTALENRPPFLAVLGHAMVRDEHGEEMHKSKGNAIWFEDAADTMGADVMRWLFFKQNPANNVNFGYGPADEVRRAFFLTLWNTYAFFVTYASLDGWTPSAPVGARTELDRWALSELHQLIETVTERLQDFDAAGATKSIEAFVDDLSNWYVRRSRRRFWKSESDSDKLAAYATLYECLVTTTKLLAPFVPFLADEMYANLVRSFDAAAPDSVHLCDWPAADASSIDLALSDDTRLVMRVASLGRAARAKASLKVRQPLATLFVKLPTQSEERALERLAPQLLDELNVKELRVVRDSTDFLRFEVKPNLKLLGRKYGKDVPVIAKDLASRSDADLAAIASAVARGESIEAAGKTLAPDELLVNGREKEGFASAEENGVVVTVSNELTPELEREGLARELVHRIQNLRKDAGFDIADRIHLYVAGDGVNEVLREYDAYIRQETLATHVAAAAPPPTAHAETADLDGLRATLAVEKV